MKMYGGVASIAPTFLTSPRDGGEWSASRPGRLIPAESTPHTPWIVGQMEPQSQFGCCGKETNLAPTRNRTPSLYPPSGIIRLF
jgi:hypothetical protein